MEKEKKDSGKRERERVCRGDRKGKWVEALREKERERRERGGTEVEQEGKRLIERRGRERERVEKGMR